MPPIAPPSHVYLRLSVPLVALVVLWTAAPAGAVERSCGADPVENTANVLCAAPSGPCTDTLVVVSANITVRNGGCDFDLGDRALRIERTIRVPGDDGDTVHGRMFFDEVADVTITRRAKLKARGDFVQPGGKIIGGGFIGFESSGRIDVSGTLDNSGEGGAGMSLHADGDVTFGSRSKTRARGISSLREADIANGGGISVESWLGGVFIDGEIDMRGGNQSFGGDIEILATRDIEVNGTLDASGTLGGGTVAVVSADDVRVQGSLIAASRNGGGAGGDVAIVAGETFGPPFAPTDGVKPHGDVSILAGHIDVRGSGSLENDPGTGGTVDINAIGTVRVGDDATIRADAGSGIPGGSGGDVSINAGFSQDVPPFPDGDIELAAFVSARGNDTGGNIDLDAVRDVVLTGTVDVTGGAFGGSVQAAAGRHVTFSGTVRARATHADGYAGLIRGFAGEIEDGTLAITTDLDAATGAKGTCDRIRMSACSLSVAPGVTFDASCGALEVGADPNVITLLARNAIDLGAASRYLAAPAGFVALVHPPGVTPTVGAGVVFTPDHADIEDASARYPACGGG